MHIRCSRALNTLCLRNRYEVPLDKLTMTATHNSFSSDVDISTHSKFEVRNMVKLATARHY